MKHGSLFTGIGGFELGFEAAGFESAWMSEIEPFCNKVLAARFPEVPNLGDVTQIRKPASVDVISFGSPCQDLSVAGRRAGFEGARSGLFFQAARIIEECSPTFAIWENVGGALNSNAGRDFRAALDIMVQLGARDVAWRVFDSQYAGVPQQRRRVYLVADFGGERAAEILFEPEGCAGHPPPSRQTGQSLAGTLTSGPRGAGRPGGSHDTDLVSHALLGNSGRNQIEANYHVEDVARAVTATSHKADRGDGISRALTASHSGNRQDATVETYVIQDVRNHANKGQNGDGIKADGLAYTLDLMSQQAVAFEPRHFTRGRAGPPSGTVPALTADADQGDGQAVVMVQNSRSEIREMSQHGTVTARQPGETGQQQHFVKSGPMIRRFTPLECERLQSFPDGWTCLCGAGVDIFACKCPDGPRYRALGNAVTASIPFWLATRIARYFS